MRCCNRLKFYATAVKGYKVYGTHTNLFSMKWLGLLMLYLISLSASFSLWIVWWQVRIFLFFYPWLILLCTCAFVYNEKCCGSQDGNCPNIQNKEGGPMLPPKSWDFRKSASEKPQDAPWARVEPAGGIPGLSVVCWNLCWSPSPDHSIIWNSVGQCFWTWWQQFPGCEELSQERFSLLAISLKILGLLFQRKLNTTLGQLFGEKFLFWEQACCSDSSLSNVKCYSSLLWLL